jgi:hypothetical protein
VTEHSNALDLEEGVLIWNDPKRMAVSLKHWADPGRIHPWRL